MAKRMREDGSPVEKEKLVVLLMDAYGDTSPGDFLATSKSNFTEEKIEKMYRSVPSSRARDSLEFYNKDGSLKEIWGSFKERELISYTSMHRCTMVIAYMNE